jgi:hypothetical protein
MKGTMQAIPEVLGMGIVERHAGAIRRRGHDPRVRSRPHEGNAEAGGNHK